ncbi:MAG TPA: hypothetical protein VN950_29065 [Terriglobales bacterium]|nr:hypothetical protein [Terriglobales bacterium]
MPTKVKNGEAAQEPYLKGKNAVYLWSFIGANLAVFLSLVVSRQFASASVDHFWERVTTKDGIIAACIPILAIVLSGVLSDVGKARLVFWRWRNPLPGCRVFTQLIATDPRIDVAALRKKHGDFPDDPQAQNALWFRLYKQHKTIPLVWEAHKIYLLTRDMTTIAAVFALVFSIGVIAASVNWRISLLYVGALCIQYVLIASAAQNYGRRFVLDVLSEESSSL